MERIVVASIAVLAFFAIASAHAGSHEKNVVFTKHFNDTLFAVAEKGQVSIELLLDDKEYKIGKDVVGIVIHDSYDKDVEDAKLTVTILGSAAALKVTEKGGGLYLVPNAGFSQQGHWKLSIAVKKKKIEDEAVFTFPEVLSNKRPAGKYDVAAQKPTADADYARTMLSKGGIFKASYTSEPDALPVNKLMIWKLKVETADGKAVKDAEITVEGDMPEHGHGMPTQPKVKNNADGTYLVEGIKFSMTGWWTVTFTIKAGGKTDSVTFNLQLK